MNLIAINTAALFVPQGSALSQVELFTRDLKPSCLQQQDGLPRVASTSEDIAELGPPMKTNLGDFSAQPTAKVIETAVDPDKLQERDMSLQWVSLKNPDQVQRYFGTHNQTRAFIIRQKNSHSRLSVSENLFEKVSTTCGFSAHFKDALAYFGSRDLEVEVAAPRLRFALLNSQQSLTSGGGFECIYGLRFVEQNNRGDPRRVYSLRQMAVCHREEIDRNLATWAFVAPPPSVMLSFSEHVGNPKTAASNKPFDVHLLLVGFAVSTWRPYLVHLARELHQHANTVLVAAPSGNGPISLSGCGNPQRLKQLGDELLDTTVAMSTTRDAVNRLIEGNMHYLLAAGVEDEASTNESENDVYHRLMEHMRELDWLMQQTDGLRQKLLGTSQLVSSLMALGNGHSLEDLGKEAREENSQIHELAKKSAQDAAAVKILTIMMLVYLPATVVSNFFSTSFVDNSSLTGPSRKLVVLANWWIFVVISVPLTIVTLYIWWFFTCLQANGTYPRWWEIIAGMKLSIRSNRPLIRDEEDNTGSISTETIMDNSGEKV